MNNKLERINKLKDELSTANIIRSSRRVTYNKALDAYNESNKEVKTILDKIALLIENS